MKKHAAEAAKNNSLKEGITFLGFEGEKNTIDSGNSAIMLYFNVVKQSTRQASSVSVINHTETMYIILLYPNM